MWEQLALTEKFFAIVIVIGSLVDIFQFTWIIKKAYVGFKRSMTERIKKEILLEELEQGRRVRLSKGAEAFPHLEKE